MSTIYAQSNIRAQLSILSNPPVAPIDINTGLAPQFWRSSGIEIDVGIFDGSEIGLDLSNLDSLQMIIQPAPTSLVPWVALTVESDDIVSPIDFADWQSGLAQNARFILTAADTDLGLQAGASRQFWMAITGFTTDGGVIVYGGGYITIYNPGNVYPPPSAGVVGYHTQNSVSGNPIVTPTALIFTEEITFTGSAGTRNIVLQAAGYPKGSKVDILGLFPDLTDGIIINIYSGSIAGSPIFSFTTDAFQPNALFQAVVNNALGYDALAQIIPAFIP